MELTNTVCLITGSTGTVGRAIAMALAQAGADCVCHYHAQADRAGQLAGDIVRLGRRAMILQADLRSPESIEELMQKAAEFGPIRMVVNSAAIFGRRQLQDVTPASIREILEMNLAAPLLISRVFVKKVLGHNEEANKNHSVTAKIVNIADVGGLRPWAGYAEYCASKAGLIAMTKALAKELAPAITVNAIAPGIVTWPDSLDEAHKQKVLSRIPLGRFVTAEEIAETVLFLARNDSITGQVIPVDGGQTI